MGVGLHNPRVQNYVGAAATRNTYVTDYCITLQLVHALPRSSVRIKIVASYVDMIDRKPCSLLRMHNVLIATCVLITMGYHEEIIM